MFMYGVPLWSRVQIVRFGLSHILHVVAAAKNSFFYGPAHHLKLLAAGDRVKALELASNSRSMPFNGLCSTILAGAQLHAESMPERVLQLQIELKYQRQT